MKHKSAILQILHGERGHFELMPHRKTKAFIKEVDEQNRIYEALKQKIPPDCLDMMDAMIDAVESKYMEELDGYYLEGFKFGVMVGMEVVSKDENEVD